MGRTGMFSEDGLLECLKDWSNSDPKLVVILKLLVVDKINLSKLGTALGNFPDFKAVGPDTVSKYIKVIAKKLGLYEQEKWNTNRIKEYCENYTSCIKEAYNQIATIRGWDSGEVSEIMKMIELVDGKLVVRFEVKIQADLEEVSWEQLTKICENICILAKTMDAQLIGIREGSIILEFEAYPETFDRLMALFKAGELTEVAGFKVLDVSILEDELEEEANEGIEKIGNWFKGIFGRIWLSRDQVPPLVEAFRGNEDEYGSIVRYRYLEFPTCLLMLEVKVGTRSGKYQFSVKLFPDASHLLPDVEQIFLPMGLKFSILDEFNIPDPELYLEVSKPRKKIGVAINEYQKFSVRTEVGGVAIVVRLDGTSTS